MVMSVSAFASAEEEGGSLPRHPISGLPLSFVEVESPDGEWRRVSVEVATTPRAKARGLMHREELSEDQGMLFVFREEGIRHFWMKNTLVPLDMIFIDCDGRIVGIVHEAEPLTQKTRSVDRPSRYVLEVRGGWAKSQGVEAGHRVRFPGIPKVAPEFGMLGE